MLHIARTGIYIIILRILAMITVVVLIAYTVTVFDKETNGQRLVVFNVYIYWIGLYIMYAGGMPHIWIMCRIHLIRIQQMVRIFLLRYTVQHLSCNYNLYMYLSCNYNI